MIKRNEASHINITLAAMIPTPAVATFTILAGTAADVVLLLLLAAEELFLYPFFGSLASIVLATVEEARMRTSNEEMIESFIFN